MEAYDQPQKKESRDTRQPYNELDLNFMLTQPAWGREITDELYSKIVKITGKEYKDKDGNIKIDAVPLWDVLGYYTRDLRLGNLGGFGGEYEYCRYWLDYAGVCLRRGYIQTFLSALSKAITIIELSQSKGGFLRKRQNTITQEHLGSNSEPAKRKLMGGKKKDGE